MTSPTSGLTYQARVAMAQKVATAWVGSRSWFLNSSVKGSRPMIPGHPSPVTKMPLAMTTTSARPGRRAGSARPQAST